MLVQMESSLVGLHSKGCRMVFCMLWHKFVDQNRWKVDGKNCEIYADLIFVCGRSPIWRTNTWNVCVLFHFSLGNPTFPQDLGFPPPPPAVFSRRAKRPWNPSSLRIITPGTSGSFGGVEAVDSDGVQLRRCGYKFEKRNHVWWKLKISKNDEMMSFFPRCMGFYLCFVKLPKQQVTNWESQLWKGHEDAATYEPRGTQFVTGQFYVLGSGRTPHPICS